MAFTVRCTTSLPPELAWAAITDFAAHTAHVPLTTVVADPAEPAVDWRFTARTALGPVGFDDPMTLTAWDPPRRFALRKTGRVLQGWAEVEVEPQGTGSVITWAEELYVPGPLRRLTRPAGDLFGPAMVRGILRGLLPPGGGVRL